MTGTQAPGSRDLPPELLERVLEQAFPFHVLVDGDGRATRIGSSLRLVCPQLGVGDPVERHLTVRTPRGVGWVAAPGARTPPGLVLVHATEGPLVLRGQLLPAAPGLLFVGSPWVTSLDGLTGLGLRLSDLAPADPVADLLMLLRAQESALADARALAARLEAAAAEQVHQARHDGLTGLPNRAHFAALVEQELQRGADVGVVLLDLDRFKDINDSLGHACGDELLRQIGPRIASALREGDVVARLGGDEFGLLVPAGTSGRPLLARCRDLAHRVLEALAEPFVVSGVTLSTEASAGIAVAPEHGSTSQSLVQRADVALYAAKATREGVSVYEPGSGDSDPRRVTRLAQLRTALDAGDLVLHYQPLLDLREGRVHGVEALVRWQHPVEGLLPPSEFIPLAEGSGAIHRLTGYVLAAACEQARAWQLAGRPLAVSVNVSARCLMDTSLPGAVRRELDRTGLPASLLTIEITESAIIADPLRAQTVIDGLHALGVRLSLDDFGTGYTSLIHLRDLPVSELKIDRSFVGRMLSEPKNAILVRTAIELADRLGLSSVAEGIEDGHTLAALAALGCTTAQGYHVARPMPVDLLETWLAARDPAPAPVLRRAG